MIWEQPVSSDFDHLLQVVTYPSSILYFWRRKDTSLDIDHLSADVDAKTLEIGILVEVSFADLGLQTWVTEIKTKEVSTASKEGLVMKDKIKIICGLHGTKSEHCAMMGIQQKICYEMQKY